MVADVMTCDPVRVDRDGHCRALDVMRLFSLAAAPVVQGEQLVGLVTEHHYMAIAAQLLLQELGGRMPSA